MDNKVVATMNFVRMLSEVENEERTYFDAQADESAAPGAAAYSFDSFNSSDNGFTVTPEMKRNISNSVDRIISSAVSSTRRDQVEQLVSALLTGRK